MGSRVVSMNAGEPSLRAKQASAKLSDVVMERAGAAATAKESCGTLKAMVGGIA